MSGFLYHGTGAFAASRKWLLVVSCWLLVLNAVAFGERYKKPFVQCGLRRIRSIANPTRTRLSAALIATATRLGFASGHTYGSPSARYPPLRFGAFQLTNGSLASGREELLSRRLYFTFFFAASSSAFVQHSRMPSGVAT